MEDKTTLLMIAGAALAGLLMVKLIYDMSTSMTEMTRYVGALSNDVAAMNSNMEQMAGHVAQMNQSMQRLEGSMRAIGRALTQGSEQFQQWNPPNVMQQVVPDGMRPLRQ